MAEAALRTLLQNRGIENVEVMSAGIAAASGYPATIYAIEAAKIWDSDLSHHQSQPLTKTLVEKADLIFGMTPTHVKEVLRLDKTAKDKTFLFKNFPDNNPDGEGVDDPIGQSLDRYNETFLEIGEYLGKYLDDIVKRIEEKAHVS